MSDTERPPVGSICWRDLTVPEAVAVRDFYARVVGWQAEPADMGEYSDFTMNAPDSGEAVAGICHARGPNADLPAQWLIYITVADVEESARRCAELGGRVLAGPRGMGVHGRYCVIQDPAGAVAALFEPSR